MRLLNTTTLKIVYYPDNKVPNYAILSHTWEIDEVTFEDFKGGSIEQKAGYHKIKHSSDIAAQNGFSFIWIDTCCIDKSSSAELSEAINSMYRYYRDAKVCYAYLADVQYEFHMTGKNRFLASKWFSRGWTLQELIAPKDLIFFSTDWRAIGTKQTLATEISQITGVDREVLADASLLQEVSVAKRMSWASDRTTTREEDIAYCLLGIFNVNMPLLYGEGIKSFLRLQEEIMKDSTDQSLFAWSPIPEDDLLDANNDRGILARHPKEFVHASNIVPYQVNRGPYTMTNKGLHIKLPVVDRKMGSREQHLAVLACHANGNFFGPICIVIRQAKDELGEVFFRSFAPAKVIDDTEMRKAKDRSIYLLKTGRSAMKSMLQHVWIRSVPQQRYGFQIDSFVKPSSAPDNAWNVRTRTMLFSSEILPGNRLGAVILKHKEHPGLIITFGYDNNFRNVHFTKTFLDISVLPEHVQDPTKLMESIWAQRLSPLPLLRREISIWEALKWLLPLRQLLLWLIVKLSQRRIWQSVSVVSRPRTALGNITTNTTVTAVATLQRIMDKEVLVLDINIRNPLWQEFVSYLESGIHKMLFPSRSHLFKVYRSITKHNILLTTICIIPILVSIHAVSFGLERPVEIELDREFSFLLMFYFEHLLIWITEYPGNNLIWLLVLPLSPLIWPINESPTLIDIFKIVTSVVLWVIDYIG